MGSRETFQRKKEGDVEYLNKEQTMVLAKRISLLNLGLSLKKDVATGKFTPDDHLLPKTTQKRVSIAPLAKEVAELTLQELNLEAHIELILDDNDVVLDNLKERGVSDKVRESRRAVLGYRWHNPLEDYDDLTEKLDLIVAVADRSKSEFADGHMGLVYDAVHKRRSKGARDMEELIGDANVGLSKAIIGFDWRLDYAFSTYAVGVIWGEMSHLFRDTGFLVGVPRDMFEAFPQVEAARTQLLKEGKEETATNLLNAARKLKPQSSLTLKKIEDVLAYNKRAKTVRSLDEINEQDPDTEKGNTANGDRGFEDELVELLLLRTGLIEKVITNPRDRRILSLFSEGGKTQKDIGKEVGFSQANVGRRIEKSLALLRKALEDADKD